MQHEQVLHVPLVERMFTHFLATNHEAEIKFSKVVLLYVLLQYSLETYLSSDNYFLTENARTRRNAVMDEFPVEDRENVIEPFVQWLTQFEHLGSEGLNWLNQQFIIDLIEDPRFQEINKDDAYDAMALFDQIESREVTDQQHLVSTLRR